MGLRLDGALREDGCMTGVSGGVLLSIMGVKGGERVLKSEEDSDAGEDVLLEEMLPEGMVSG